MVVKWAQMALIFIVKERTEIEKEPAGFSKLKI